MAKLKAINRVSEMVRSQGSVAKYFNPHLEAVMDMIEANIFRPLPSIKKAQVDEADGVVEQDEYDMSWTYLQGIYDIFLGLAVSDEFEPHLIKSYITPTFIQRFLELFDSQMSTEREYLKNILHKLYAKIV